MQRATSGNKSLKSSHNKKASHTKKSTNKIKKTLKKRSLTVPHYMNENMITPIRMAHPDKIGCLPVSLDYIARYLATGYCNLQDDQISEYVVKKKSLITSISVLKLLNLYRHEYTALLAIELLLNKMICEIANHHFLIDSPGKKTALALTLFTGPVRVARAIVQPLAKLDTLIDNEPKDKNGMSFL